MLIKRYLISLALLAMLLSGCSAATLGRAEIRQPIPTFTSLVLPSPAAPEASATAPAATATLAAPVTVAARPPISHVNLLKGPDVLYTGKNTEMKLFWQWNARAAFRVDWGTDETYALGSQNVSEYDPEYHLYAVNLSGLTPGTKYFYAVVVNNQAATGSFVTAPGADAQALKFISYGDTRTNVADHEAVAAQVMALTQADPAYQTLNLMEGDLVADGLDEDHWRAQFFDPSLKSIRAELANLAVLPVMGNHERNTPLFSRYFPLPYVDAHYWSFDYGPMHVVMLDQYIDYGQGSAQYAWMKADLSASRQPWKVVVLHEPGWSAGGGHANNLTVQNDLQPLFEQTGVQLVLGGHLHYYARAEVNGVTHLTIGSGGAPLYTPDQHMPKLVTAIKTNGYCKFEIQGNTLKGWFVDTQGEVRDSFVIER